MSMIGQTIAHYTITEKLGQGGMGEVYRASDTKLNRGVALKILPESFAGDPHRMGRFHQEAQVLASLNHPNIAAIHGAEAQADGRRSGSLQIPGAAHHFHGLSELALGAAHDQQIPGLDRGQGAEIDQCLALPDDAEDESAGFRT